jgi:hypothetical protein
MNIIRSQLLKTPMKDWIIVMTDHPKTDPPTKGEANASASSGTGPCAGVTQGVDPNKRYVNITAMIRSLQRTEGVVDCFRREITNCAQPECAWRRYCLGSEKDVLMDNNA